MRNKYHHSCLQLYYLSGDGHIWPKMKANNMLVFVHMPVHFDCVLVYKVHWEWGKSINPHIVSSVDTGLLKLFVNILYGLFDMLFNGCVSFYRDVNGIRNWKDEDQGAAAGVTCAFACDVPSTCRWRLLELYFSSSAQHLLCCVQHCCLLGLMFHSWIVLCWRKILQLFSTRWAISWTILCCRKIFHLFPIMWASIVAVWRGYILMPIVNTQ